MAKLDSLIVDLQMNTAELRKGLDEANKKLADFGGKMNDLAKVVTFDKIGGLALDAAKAMATFTMHGAETADRMGKMAQSAGVTVEAFSQLNYAASLSNVSTDDLGTALLKLNKLLADAGSGGKEQVALFRSLGISITDASGKMRSADSVFAELATKFSKMNDGAGKAKLATELFGKSGAQLIPLLNSGAASLSALAAEADRFGITVSSSAARSAEQFNDNLAKMRAAFDGVAQRAAAELTPALSKLTNQLLNTKEGSESLKSASEVLATALKLVASVAVVVGGVLDAVATRYARVASGVVNVFRGDFASAAEDFGSQFDDLSKSVTSAYDRLAIIWTDEKPKESVKETAAASEESAEKIAAAFERMKAAAQKAQQSMDALKKVALDLETQVATFDLNPIDAMLKRLEEGDLAQHLRNVGAAAEEVKARIIAATKALMELNESKLNVKLTRQEDATERATDNRVADFRRQYDTAGMTDKARLKQDAGAFESFEAALHALAENTRKHTSALGDAELARERQDEAAVDAATELAAKYEYAAEVAGDSAKAFVELKKLDVASVRAHMEKILSGLAAAGQQMLTKLEDLGEVIQAGLSGFQTGGWWGAIIAVVIELFSRFTRFSEIIEIGNSQLAQILEFLGPALNTLTNAFKQFMRFSGEMSRVIFTVLQPVLTAISRIFGYIANLLTPIMASIANTLEPVLTISQALFDVADALGVMETVIQVVAFIFNAISLATLGVMTGIYKAWGWVLGAVRDVMKFFGLSTTEIEATIAKHAQATADMEGRLSRVWNNMTDPNAATMDPTPVETPELGNLGDIAGNLGDLGDNAGTAADALATFARALTNVPEGFRYAAAAFNSTDPQAGASVFGSAGNTVVHVHGSVFTSEELAAVLEKASRRAQHRRTGFGSLPGDQP